MMRATHRGRRRPRLVLEIALVLALKLIALAVIWNIWFSNPQGKAIDGDSIASAIYSAVRAKTDAARP